MKNMKKLLSHPLSGVCAALAVLIAAVCLQKISFPLSLALFIAALIVVGYPVGADAVRGLLRRDLLDEKFLMCIGEYTEAVAVMLF